MIKAVTPLKFKKWIDFVTIWREYRWANREKRLYKRAIRKAAKQDRKGRRNEMDRQ